MPIDMTEWNSGRKEYTLKEKILIFLSTNQEQAFDIKEIIEGTGYSIPVVTQNYSETPQSRFRNILEILAEEGSVEIRKISKTLGEELYYKITESYKKPKDY